MPNDIEDEIRRGLRYPNGERIKDPGNPVGESTGATIPPPRPRHSASPIPLILILAGVFFFLSNIGIVRMSDIGVYWPVILIVVGLSGLFRRHNSARGIVSIVPVLVGVIFLLRNLHLFSIHLRMIWPLALIVVGLLMLAKHRGHGAGHWHREGHGHAAFPGASEENADRLLHDWAVFGGVSRVITSQNFLGGELFSAFGGIEIDLRQAGVAPGDNPVVIEANTMFGGISIKAPDTWRVAVRGTGIFGGYQDELLRTRQPDPTAPLLIVNGFAMFGGVVVE